MEVIDNVIQAYEAVKLNDVSKGIIALCTFVAIIIVIQKFVTAWKEAFSEGDRPADMKQFFKLFYIYIYVFAIIGVNLYGGVFAEFATFGSALFTLLQTFTLDGWASAVARPVMAFFPESWLFFVAFIFGCFLIVISFLMTALIQAVNAVKK